MANSARKSQIPGLDGIRGIAVLAVFLFHAELLPHVPGELATTVFFFLSGFLITTLFIKEWRKSGTIDLKAFYKRRALRILPPLYLVLFGAVFASLALHVGGPPTPWKAAGHFLQYTNYAVAMRGELAGFLPGMILLWSLAVDEHYYLAFAPAFRAALRRFRPERIAGALLAVCALILAWRCHLVSTAGYAGFRVSMATDTRMDSILWGSVAALWRNPALEPERAAWLAKPLPVLAGILGLLVPFLSHSDEFKCTFGYTLEGLSLIPLFTAAILHGKGFGRFLEWRALLWTSRISYPLYLLSWWSIMVSYKFVHAPKPVQFLVAFGAAYLIASAIHLWIEQPIARLRQRRRVEPEIFMPLRTAA